MAKDTDLKEMLNGLYDAERTTRDLMQKVLKVPHDTLLEEVRKAIGAVQTKRSESEQAVRLVCLARVLRDIPGPGAIDLLIDILGSDSDEAMYVAGATLEDVSHERSGEVQAGVERALTRLPVGNMALQQLPFVLLGGPEHPRKLLEAFLKHADPAAVASAVEAFVDLADPNVIPLLEKLSKDERVIEDEDESTGEITKYTIGEFVSDAIDTLREVETAMHGDSGN
jgi:HEAT repeat protein